jgi:two-component system OmpR family sensor kinase
VEDLLLLARLDQEPEPRRTPVDLRQLVQQAGQDVGAMAPDRDVTVHADGPCTVLGDPDQLRQLLGNLTRNAVIHTPPGTPIELELAATDADVRLEVRDHGPGLPPGAEDRLFERFWRSEGGRHRGRGGAGLGLAISRAIATAHHGEVHADNAPDGGARFVVTLPAAGRPKGSQEALSLLTSHSYLNATH